MNDHVCPDCGGWFGRHGVGCSYVGVIRRPAPPKRRGLVARLIAWLGRRWEKA